MCNAEHDAMNAMRANAIAERRRSRHAAHSESAEIGVAGRALVLSLRDSNRQRTINSGGERDEDARSIRKWGKKTSDCPVRVCEVSSDVWLFPRFSYLALIKSAPSAFAL